MFGWNKTKKAQVKVIKIDPESTQKCIQEEFMNICDSFRHLVELSEWHAGETCIFDVENGPMVSFKSERDRGEMFHSVYVEGVRVNGKLVKGALTYCR